MKVLKGIGLSIIMALFLTNQVTYAQRVAEESLNKGLEYGSRGKFKEAKEEFGKALKGSKFQEGRVATLQCLEIIKDVTEQKLKGKTAIHFFKGGSYAHKGRIDQAIMEYTRAIETNPSFAVAYNSRGLVYSVKGQYDKALKDFTTALTINPRFAAAYTARASIYVVKGRYEKAIIDLTRAIEINPRLAVAYTSRGLVYFFKEQYDDAIIDFTKALEMNPSLGAIYTNRANAYYSKGRYGAAWEDVKKAQDLGYHVDPEFLEALRSRSK